MADMMIMETDMRDDDCYAGIDRCQEWESPFCTVTCPFHLDVLSFLEKLSRKNYNAAYRIYRDMVAYPMIVSSLCTQPCKAVCPRQKIDAAIDLRQLEVATSSMSSHHKPMDFHMPLKAKRIAIIGAGPCGLACMSRLSARGYQTVIYEKSNRIGGRLWNELPKHVFLNEFDEQHQFLKFEMKRNSEISTLDGLNGFDAIFIATGNKGPDFGLRGENAQVQRFLGMPAEQVLGDNKRNTFAGGSLFGADSVEAIAAGLQAANIIESYLKTGKSELPEPMITRLAPDVDWLLRRGPDSQILRTTANQPDRSNQEWVAAEVEKCLRCHCDSCVQNCEMLASFHKSIHRVHDEAMLAAKPTSVDGTSAQGRRMVSSCSQCGRCERVCPEQISIGNMMLESRRALHSTGKMPWAFHEYWLRSMKHANSLEASFVSSAPGYGKSNVLFFPGCQLSGALPAAVTATYEELVHIDESTGIFLGCCGIPAVWAGDVSLFDQVKSQLDEGWKKCGEPLIAFACPGCQKNFAEYLPHIPGISVSEYLCQNGTKAKRVGRGEAICVYDPCTARLDKEAQTAVRTLLQEAGYVLRELPNSENISRCCGFGGHIYPANPPLLQSIASHRVGMRNEPYVVYCSNCRDIFASQGKEATHLLEVLFDLPNREIRIPTPTERHHNLTKLKADLVNSVWGITPKEQIRKTDMKIVFSKIAREQTAKELLLEDDVAEAVWLAEQSGRKILDQDTENIFAMMQVGHCTCWVAYRIDSDICTVHDVYCHRMKIGKSK